MTTETPEQTPKAPERIACEAFWTAVGAGPDGIHPDAAWAWAQTMGAGHAWRAVVDAVTADDRAAQAPGIEMRMREALEVIAERNRLREEFAEMRGRVLAVADELEAAANATHPSKKSDIERAAAKRLRTAVEGS
jgi:hypothetical protein